MKVQNTGLTKNFWNCEEFRVTDSPGSGGREKERKNGGTMGFEDKNCQRQKSCGKRHLRFSIPNSHHFTNITFISIGKSDPYLRVSQDNVPLHTTATVSLLKLTFIPFHYYVILVFKRQIYATQNNFLLQLHTTGRVSQTWPQKVFSMTSLNPLNILS